MLSLKRFLDGLADEDHPFRRGPDMRKGSALPTEEMKGTAKVRSERTSVSTEQQTRFYFMRLNKN